MSYERDSRIEQMHSPYGLADTAYGGRREEGQYGYHAHSPGPANYGGRRMEKEQQPQHNPREMFSFQQQKTIRRSVSRSLSKERRMRKDSDSSPY